MQRSLSFAIDEFSFIKLRILSEHAYTPVIDTPCFLHVSCQVHQLLWIDTLNLDGIVTEHVPVRRSYIFRSYTQYSDIIYWGRYVFLL